MNTKFKVGDRVRFRHGYTTRRSGTVTNIHGDGVYLSIFFDGDEVPVGGLPASRFEPVIREDEQSQPGPFYLFAGNQHYPLGGIRDLKGTFPTVEDALRYLITEGTFDWWQIAVATDNGFEIKHQS